MSTAVAEDLHEKNLKVLKLISEKHRLVWSVWCKNRAKDPARSKRDQAFWSNCAVTGPQQLFKAFDDLATSALLKSFSGLLGLEDLQKICNDSIEAIDQDQDVSLDDLLDFPEQKKNPLQQSSAAKLQQAKLEQKESQQKNGDIDHLLNRSGRLSNPNASNPVEDEGKVQGQLQESGEDQAQKGEDGESSGEGQRESAESQGESQGEGDEADGDGEESEESEDGEGKEPKNKKQEQKEEEQQKQQQQNPPPPPPPPPAPAPKPPETKEDQNTKTSLSDITDKIQVPKKHFRTASLKKILRARDYPLLWGPPGSGKTHLIESIAAEMEIDFLLLTLTQDSMRSEALGSKSPLTGEYFATKFRKLWENGGVILFDEVGLASAGLLNLFNSALAQGVIDFPDGKRIFKHDHCFPIFADNSNLRGNDLMFPERQDLGGAFRDRLTYIHFEYDTKLELMILESIFGSNYPALAHQRLVSKIREILKQENVPVFASPRFSFRSARRMLEGFKFAEICDMELWQGLDEDTLSQVKKKILALQV